MFTVTTSLLRCRAISIVVASSKRPPPLRRMSFHFASTEYARCFVDLPQPDTAALRKQTIDYLDSFDSQLWYTDPMVSILNGSHLSGSTLTDTENALGQVNGTQALASPEQVEMIKQHIRSFESPYTDLRMQMRNVEQSLLNRYAGFLIGNQCLDFQKQDGITEIEEAIMANTVERRLNDLLLQDEANCVLQVNRQPIYVSCVSNFSNFLDLFRKTIRSLEVGVPVVILSRSNTAQHCFRWTQLLAELMKEQDVDSGMITFACCSLDDIIDITRSCKEHTGNLYTTCSRELAAAIKENYPNTVASTGGPNTLVTTELTESVKKAIQMSASIESSGQCTALRHCVVPPGIGDAELKSIFGPIQEIHGAPQAVKKGVFDGIFRDHKGSAVPDKGDYKQHDAVDAFYKVGKELPPAGMHEYWRKVVVDFSMLQVQDSNDLQRLATWLNTNQPISLAVNGPRKEAIKLGLELFGKTGMVVNTIGSTDDADMPPAMTCQARPQEAEVFGEFPPRASLHEYTCFPVVVPSSNPSYDASYTTQYLKSQAVPEFYGESTKKLIGLLKDASTAGYCVCLVSYLKDVARFNPKQGFGKSRTAVWGLQRPPLGTKTILYCNSTVTWDNVCPIYILFHASTARPQVELSIDPANTELQSICREYKIPHSIESSSQMKARVDEQRALVFNTVHVNAEPMQSFPMVGNFVSLYLPLGHIKSTKPNDEEFILLARLSEKWLNSLF